LAGCFFELYGPLSLSRRASIILRRAVLLEKVDASDPDSYQAFCVGPKKAMFHSAGIVTDFDAIAGYELVSKTRGIVTLVCNASAAV